MSKKKKIKITSIKSDEAFHRSRVAFGVINGKIEYLIHDPREHADWFRDEFNIDKEKFENIIRGYIKPGKVMVYQGSNFNPVDRTKITRELITDLLKGCKTYFGKGNYKFYNGVHIGKIGEEWLPIQTISDFDVE